jgi:hypothetical protein
LVIGAGIVGSRFTDPAAGCGGLAMDIAISLPGLQVVPE